ncbi:flagellar type III secretion system protein FlhB [Alphaproteobacteria bacterium GH1-50]|uniref:Flagellar type III secretion system protein FlhB n=1 Tax=Kangsaoukella pontilimi TaxID=2691042 RepID=A0A7C9IPL3_9RHOB|nr:flagellar type III secretion system protein FlhB [Kangsaoukella pontilimi]MXQ08170.1 flagellar type III secretion system protein FlhB [Kangsaoukella pontilimi]
MSKDEEDSSEKPFDATPRKLEQARKQGDVPISQDLLTAGVYFSVLVCGAVFGLWSVSEMGATLAHLLGHADSHAERALGPGTLIGDLLGALAVPGAVWLLFPVGAALLVAIAQRALVFAPAKLNPKLSRISPLSNAKQKFGRDGLFNFAKSAVKLAVYSGALAYVGMTWAEDILMSSALPVESAMGLGVDLTLAFMSVALLVIVVIGGIDFFWQRAEHMRKQRMSLKELRDELKESEGDPYTKQARRQFGYDIATNRMLADVPQADVVVVNPTHYAVALKWARTRGTAPVCVAKGVDNVALRIRQVAAEAEVPIHSDPPTARSLYATVEIGSEIPPEHYRAVAAAIRFADTMRRRSAGDPT